MTMTVQWPKQSECGAFYGDPRGNGRPNAGWVAQNLRTVTPPFAMHIGHDPVHHIQIHKKCSAALLQWLKAVWKNGGTDQKVMDLWGMSAFSGSFAYRSMRGRNSLSMHAYGCALDFDAARNDLADGTPNFSRYRKQIVQPFLELGGVWGGDWNGNGSSADERRPDGMHFQFARMG